MFQTSASISLCVSLHYYLQLLYSCIWFVMCLYVQILQKRLGRVGGEICLRCTIFFHSLPVLVFLQTLVKHVTCILVKAGIQWWTGTLHSWGRRMRQRCSISLSGWGGHTYTTPGSLVSNRSHDQTHSMTLCAYYFHVFRGVLDEDER